MMMDQEPVAALDAVWMQMETEKQPMMISTIIKFGDVFPLQTLLKIVAEKVLCYRKFRSCYHGARLLPLAKKWRSDPGFHLHSHIHHIIFRRKFRQESLESLLSELANRPFDRQKPLWDMYLLDYEDEGSYLLIRMHHALGDGKALLSLLSEITDEDFTSTLPDIGMERGQQEGKLPDKLWEWLNQSLSLSHMVFLTKDPPSCFSQSTAHRCQLSFSEAIPISSLKNLAHRINGTVSDVLIGLAAGALRRVALQHEYPAVDIRAILPVAFGRQQQESMKLVNQLGLVFVDLPLGKEKAWQRLVAAKENLAIIKSSQDTQVASGIMTLMGTAYPLLAVTCMNFFARKASLMLTSIPGPPTALHIAGIKIDDLLVFAPTASRLALGMSFMSYAGHLRLGVSASLDLHPAEMTKAFYHEWQEVDSIFH